MSTIRILTEEDAEIYRAIRLRALRENPEAFASSYEDEETMPFHTFAERLRPRGEPSERFTLGAFNDDQALIGTITLLREETRKMRHKGLIVGMYVVPEARGQGVGRLLLQEAIARAKAIPGLERLLLAVVTTNPAARGLYASLGFQTYGVEPQAMKQGEQYWDEEYMTLSLHS